MKKVILAATLILSTQSAFASLGAQSFVYHGRVYGADGATPVNQIVDVIFDILAPNGCLLYEEKQLQVDLSRTNGALSLQVGSMQNSAMRTANDPGLSMSDVFNNGKVVAAGSGCSSGYNGQSGDIRKLHVSLAVNGGAFTALSPDLPLGSVPSSINSDTLQGLKPADIIQVKDQVTQSNVSNLVNGSDVGALHNHDSAYVKLGATPTFPSASVTAVGSSSSSATNKSYVDSAVSGVQSQVNSISTKQTQDEGNISANALTITSLQTSVSGNTTAIQNLQTSVSGNTTAIQNTQTSVSNLTTTVSSNKTAADSALALKVNYSDIPSCTAGQILSFDAPTKKFNCVAMVVGSPGDVVQGFYSACPAGTLLADGTAKSSVTYPGLWSALGVTYGPGSSSTTVTLPNAQAMFLRGAGTQTINGVTYSAAARGTPQPDMMQGHVHGIPQLYATYGSGTGATYVGSGGTVMNQTQIGGIMNDGSNGDPRIGTETRPTNLSVKTCIRY